MKKKLIGMLCGAAAVAMAVPALAEVTFSGTFTTQGLVEETSFGKDVDAQNMVAMRMRPKVTNKINDLVTLVYFGEFDIDWGVDGAKSAGNDGKQAGDGINLETKSLYVDLKPSKDFPLSFRVGLQGFADSINNVYFNEDATGLAAMGQFGPVALTAGWAKLAEGDLEDQDDSDLYLVKASMKPSDTVKVGMDVFYAHNDDTAAKDDSITLWTIAPNVAVSVAGVNIDGFFAYQFGKDDGADVDTKAYTGSVGASMNMAPASFGLRVIYYGKDGDDEDDQAFKGNIGELAYVGEGLPIFLADYSKTGANAYHNDSAAIQDAAQAGYGLLGLTAKAKVDFAPFWFKCALGYFQALDDSRNDEAAPSREGKALGTEIAAEVGMKMAEVASLTLRGSYALLGDFYDTKATNIAGEDPDNPYILGLLLSVPF